MILEFSEIQLKRISLDDIELLRTWRNDPKIVANMFFSKYISPEMQEQWYLSLKPSDFYFIIICSNQPIGLIHLFQENDEDRSAYAGLFIYEEKFLGSPFSILASILLLNFAFEERKLKLVKAKIREDNFIAISYNQQLGFKQISKTEWELSEETYQKLLVPFQQKLKNLFGK
jgi:UDP-4-amino-4,6-dideoxy-N-acetyl-beta-L-altrosamine N-acetyltransferase